MKHQDLYNQIHSEIFHTHDGPLTSFVATYRAMQLASIGKYMYEDIANVLYEGLKDFEELPSTEIPNSY